MRECSSSSTWRRAASASPLVCAHHPCSSQLCQCSLVQRQTARPPSLNVLPAVRSFGTEGRRDVRQGPQVPPNSEIYNFIIFKGKQQVHLGAHSCSATRCSPCTFGFLYLGVCALLSPGARIKDSVHEVMIYSCAAGDEIKDLTVISNNPPPLEAPSVQAPVSCVPAETHSATCLSHARSLEHCNHKTSPTAIQVDQLHLRSDKTGCNDCIPLRPSIAVDLRQCLPPCVCVCVLVHTLVCLLCWCRVRLPASTTLLLLHPQPLLQTTW